MPKAKVDALFHHLGRTGSVTIAAGRGQLRRSALFQRSQKGEAFAERWAKALDLGIERRQDNTMSRAPSPGPRDTEEPVWRNARRSIRVCSSTTALCNSCSSSAGPISLATRPCYDAAVRREAPPGQNR